MPSALPADIGPSSNRIILSLLRLKGLILGLSLGSVCVALLALLSDRSDTPALEEWRMVSLALLGVILFLSVGLFLVRRVPWMLALLLGKLMLVILVAIPFGDSLLLKLALWISLFLDAGGYMDLPVSAIAQTVSLAIIMFLQRPYRAWGQDVVGLGAVPLIASGACLAGLALLLVLLRSSSSTIKAKIDQLERLDDAVRQMTVTNLSFQKIASTAQERSAEDERKRITRDIHDAIGYALTNLIMVMEAALRLVPENGEKLQELLGRAREEAQVGLNETRKALHMLRSVPQERVKGLTAIHRLVTIFTKATGVTVNAAYCNADQSFGDEKDMIIYRMVQEGMTNSFRHGHATRISLKFWQDESGITVTIGDNGVGSGDVKEGIGLQGMRERVEQIGGSFRADRVMDGFELAAWLPLGTGSSSRTESGA